MNSLLIKKMFGAWGGYPNASGVYYGLNVGIKTSQHKLFRTNYNIK